MCTSSLAWWILGIFIVILIIDQVRNNVALSNVDQKTVSNYDRALEFGKRSIPLTQVLDLILPIKGVTLDVKLAALVVIPSAHHGVHRWLVFARIRVVWIVHWDNEVIHFLLENLLPRCIFDVASGCTSSVVRLFFIIVTFRAILHSEVSESVELLSARSVFVPY